MAVTVAPVTVATTPTAIHTPAGDDASGAEVVVKNTGGQDVFLGPSTVTTANGFPLAAGATSPTLTLSVGEALYGIVAATTATVRVLAVTGRG